MCKSYVAYTDGSLKGSPGNTSGGWASIILEKGKVIKKLYSGLKNTTSNRMEITAVLETLKYFKEPSNIVIYSDSQYVVNSINMGWVKHWFEKEDYEKKNIDLWFEILDLLEFHNVTLIWVKGHNVNKWNNYADMLAQHAACCLNLKEDHVKAITIQETG